MFINFIFLLEGITFFAKIISVVDCFMQFSFIWCRGQKPPTLMPTDCSVLRTPTILPNIRISWDYHPTFMLISGRVLRSFTHLWASSCGLRPFDPGIIACKYVIQESSGRAILRIGFWIVNVIFKSESPGKGDLLFYKSGGIRGKAEHSKP